MISVILSGLPALTTLYLLNPCLLYIHIMLRLISAFWLYLFLFPSFRHDYCQSIWGLPTIQSWVVGIHSSQYSVVGAKGVKRSTHVLRLWHFKFNYQLSLLGLTFSYLRYFTRLFKDYFTFHKITPKTPKWLPYILIGRFHRHLVY